MKYQGSIHKMNVINTQLYTVPPTFVVQEMEAFLPGISHQESSVSATHAPSMGSKRRLG